MRKGKLEKEAREGAGGKSNGKSKEKSKAEKRRDTVVCRL
jgi:hypothetical protein